MLTALWLERPYSGHGVRQTLGETLVWLGQTPTVEAVGHLEPVPAGDCHVSLSSALTSPGNEGSDGLRTLLTLPPSGGVQ